MIKVKKVVVEKNGTTIAKKGLVSFFFRLLEFTIKQDDQA